MHVVDMILFWARITPQQPALILPSMIITFEALVRAMAAVAKQARSLGLDPGGEPVAVAIADPARQLAALAGLLKAEFTVAPLDGAAQVSHLAAAGIRTLVTDAPDQAAFGGRTIAFTDAWLPDQNSEAGSAEALPAGPVRNGTVILLTSGSSGPPRPVVVTKDAHIARLRMPALFTGFDYTKALIVPGPATSYGWNAACTALAAGKAACFAPWGEPMLWLASTFRIDALVASAHQALALAALQHALDYELGTLKAVSVSGAPVTEAMVRRLQATLCRKVFIEYASTEGSLAAMASFDTVAHVPLAAGYLAPGTDLEIVDAHDQAVPSGADGRIRYRTPFFSLNDGRDTWFYPGDWGRMSADGILSVFGRDDDMLACDAGTIPAAIVDERLQAVAGVRDAAACGVLGPDGGGEIWAGIVPAPAFDRAAVRRSVDGADLSGARVDELLVVDEIPRTALGQVRRTALREVLQRVRAGGRAAAGNVTSLRF